MAWDLRGALLKKEERETARLMDFEFRLRARTMRILAARLNIPAETLVPRIAEGADDVILTALARERDEDLAALGTILAEATSEAREQLVKELGDPAPYRLA